MQWIDPNRFGQRQKWHKQDDQCRDGLHEHAHNKQQQVDHQDDQEPIVGNAKNAIGDGLRDTFRHQYPAKDIGKAYQRKNARSRGSAFNQDAWQLGDGQFTVDEGPDNKGIDRSHNGGFRWSGEARKQPVDDQEGHRQGPECPRERARDFSEALPFLTGEVLADRDHIGRDHHCDTHEDARHRTGQEHLAHGNARQRADDDHRHRGGNDRSNGRRCGSDRSGEIRWIPSLFHARDHDTADGSRVSHRRAGNAAKQHRGRNVGQSQTTRDPAHQRICKPDDALGDPAPVHQVAREDETRNGQQNKNVHSSIHFLRHDHHWDARYQQIGQR